ncbi:DUF3100 domain-containing protein [Zophobihabitans entericus]|uniref:DUF3100 domain-containing protein n=1 Tax=Zophobihabitans entericus TaxID=1635327 RepID=A0A6G9IBS0_9GAMM|nr:DUF3100 domain-containing protein [Zophobihabitans entericus]QIQ21269.1 DUF3100 domain-containing protein [Zophobihabitans entericus]
MEILKDWKLHIIALLVVVVCELIGIIKLGMIVLLPMIFAMVIGGIISIPKLKILSEGNMKRASTVMTVSLMLLIAKLGLDIGPNLNHIFNAKGALIFQEVGHFFGTILFGLPIAVALGMGREAVGATYSVAREPNIAIIADKYGLDSPEGRGVMSMYICGTLFGAIWISILTTFIGQLDILHPYALAMGAGVGSGSMMAASTGSIVTLYPEMESSIRAYAASANLLSSILGIYIYMFFSLPLASKMYGVFRRLFGKDKG